MTSEYPSELMFTFLLKTGLQPLQPCKTSTRPSADPAYWTPERTARAQGARAAAARARKLRKPFCDWFCDRWSYLRYRDDRDDRGGEWSGQSRNAFGPLVGRPPCSPVLTGVEKVSKIWKVWPNLRIWRALKVKAVRTKLAPVVL